MAVATAVDEIAYLLIHEKLPNTRELAAYRRKLAALRGVPPKLRTLLENLPTSSASMEFTTSASWAA